MDETTDAVAACLRLVRFFARESCGKCTPCREGTTWLERILRRIIDGYGRPEDLGLLASVGDNISPGPYPNAAWEAEGLEAVPFPPRQTTICPLGPSAVAPITSALRRFRPEFEAYIAAAENNRPRLTVTADPPPADRVDGASAAGGAHV
jgi:NADH-quinone oxidoreductase subunit F